MRARARSISARRGFIRTVGYIVYRGTACDHPRMYASQRAPFGLWVRFCTPGTLTQCQCSLKIIENNTNRQELEATPRVSVQRG